MNKHPSTRRLRDPALWWNSSTWIALAAFVSVMASPLSALAKSSWSPTLVVNTEAFQTIEDADTSSNVVLKFGEGLAKTLTYNRSAGQFEFNDDLEVTGTMSGANLTFMGATSSYILGNLGVGLTNPETKLEVAGTISGATLKASGNLNVSGSLVTELNTGGGVLYSNTGTLATTAKGSSGQVLVARGTAAPEFKNPTGSMVWYVDGTLAVATRQGATVTMPFGMTLTSINLRVSGAPTGTALIVDINDGGTTVFSTRPQIDAGAVTGGGGASFSDTLLAAGSEISVDIDQVGSTFAGSGLTVQLNGVRKY